MTVFNIQVISDNGFSPPDFPPRWHHMKSKSPHSVGLHTHMKCNYKYDYLKQMTFNLSRQKILFWIEQIKLISQTNYYIINKEPPPPPPPPNNTT